MQAAAQMLSEAKFSEASLLEQEQRKHCKLNFYRKVLKCSVFDAVYFQIFHCSQSRWIHENVSVPQAFWVFVTPTAKPVDTVFDRSWTAINTSPNDSRELEFGFACNDAMHKLCGTALKFCVSTNVFSFINTSSIVLQFERSNVFKNAFLIGSNFVFKDQNPFNPENQNSVFTSEINLRDRIYIFLLNTQKSMCKKLQNRTHFFNSGAVPLGVPGHN